MGWGLVWLLAVAAWASGPRYVTGAPFYTGTAGVPVVWKQSRLLYFTDPGGLSANVNHAAADALVSAAAGVWNVPVASLTVAQGGGLAEHVSGANTYLGTNGMVWPADVASTNAGAIPVAVVYDTDGSVTDLLLGSGASAPSSCRQNGVTESVDAFDPAGYIVHAILVVNGRCTGSAAAAQSQLQYQLERGFGRILGLAWSQANDNVFTGTPQPTYDQAMHWPVMHPLDIICGAYTYQCLPSPFMLRPDDVASLALLYPNSSTGTLAAGKQPTLGAAEGVFGEVDFPTSQGMAGVNVVAQRQSSADGSREGWVTASAVTGTLFRRNGTSPFVAADTSSRGSEGTGDGSLSGRYFIAYLPLQSGASQQTVVISTEAVNPLYTGTHSVEPYAAGIVTPSGSTPAPVVYPQATSNGDALGFFTIADAASSCGSGLDGTASSPVAADASGWWTGLICGYGHASYLSLAVRQGRSFTVQVTGLDENGYATTGKLMPVMGVYAATDGPAALPSIGVAAGAFNGLGAGTTTLTVSSAATGGTTQMRVGIGDQRGDGRPDFAFQGRILYADTVLPAHVPTAGGQVTITGMGFRAGNQVTVNGVAATVSNVSSTSLTVMTPAMAAAGATAKTAVDVTVRDLSTGAVSGMSGALTYDDSAAGPDGMKLVSAPSGTVNVGTAATPVFAVQVLSGTTSVPAQAVVFSAAQGTVVFGACGAATCTVTTDANGMASTGVTASAAGVVTVQATDGSLSQAASFTAVASDGSLTVVSAPSGNVPNGTAAGTAFAVKVLGADGKTPVSGRPVTFTVTQGAASYGACMNATCAVKTDGSGVASVTVTPSVVGPVTLQASDGGLTQTAQFTSTNSTDVLHVAAMPAVAQYAGQAPAFTVQLLHADGVTPDANERISFTATGGGVVYPCGYSPCTQRTASDGTATINVTLQTAGTVTVTASYGALAQTAVLTFSKQSGQLVLVSAPTGSQAVGIQTGQAFTVQLLGSNGQPVPGVPLPVSGPLDQVQLGCGLGGCLLTTDGNGVASTTVLPLRAGTILLTAQYGSLTQAVSFTAVGAGKTMNVLTQPGGGTYAGDLESFVVQVLGPDGVTPVAGDVVNYAVATGSFGFSGCATTSCPTFTDASGKASMSGVSSAPGTVTVTASDGTVTQSMSFTTVARLDGMKVVSQPEASVDLGAMAKSPFSVTVLHADGVTPVAGTTVTFANGGSGSGQAQFVACGAAACAISTDQNGSASTGVTGAVAGATALTATLAAAVGGASVSVPLQVVNDQQSLNAVDSVTYLEQGQSFAATLEAVATLNGAAATGLGVSWSAGTGVTLGGPSSVSDRTGAAVMGATLGPLAAGASAMGKACAWTAVCTSFTVNGVADGALVLAVTGGGLQTLTGGAAAALVAARVTDGLGHPVAGALVQVYQTVTASATACPAKGRCPAAAVLRSSSGTLTSDAAGLVSVVPLLVPGTATETKVLLTAGTVASVGAQVWNQP